MTSKAHTSADQVPFDIPVLPSLREDYQTPTGKEKRCGMYKQ